MDFGKSTLFGLLLVVATTVAAGADGEIYSLTATLTEQDRGVAAVAFSPDGSKIVLALDDASARLKDTSGGEGTLLKWEGEPAFSVVFSPDGARIATAGHDGVRIWDVASGRPVAQFIDPKTSAPIAALNPDGSRIVLVIGANEGKAQILDIATAREIAVLDGHESGITDATYSPDGAVIATASADKTVRLWDAENGRQIALLRHDQWVHSVAFSPDGKHVVTGARGGAAHIYEVATGREALVLRAETDDILSARFSRDGTRIVTGSDDDSVRIWDVASGKTIAVLNGHLGDVYAAAFSPDGNSILSAADDATGRIWTRLPAVKMPDGIAGVWYQYTLTPDAPADLVRDVARIYCLTSPFNIHEDGLIISFVADAANEPPAAKMHLRCAADLSCKVFVGAPAQGLEPLDTARLTLSGAGAELCSGGECSVLARCPAIAWTDEEKASGFAAAWEKNVLGKVGP